MKGWWPRVCLHRRGIEPFKDPPLTGQPEDPACERQAGSPKNKLGNASTEQELVAMWDVAVSLPVAFHIAHRRERHVVADHRHALVRNLSE